MSTIDFTLPENQRPMLKLFPLMPLDELKELAEDIKKNGQRDAVEVFYDDSYDDGRKNRWQLLLDGQNRIAACKMASVSPHIAYKGLSNFPDESALMSYVLSKNMKRRHLTPAQRGAIAVSASDLLTKLQREAKERQQAAVAKANAERKALAAAAKAMQDDPEEAETAVKEIAEAACTEVNKQPKGSVREKIAAVADISPSLAQSLLFVQKHAPDLLSKIVSGSLSVDAAESQAHQIADEKKRKERVAKAAVKPQKPKMEKPAREHGIFKVGAVLLAKDTARWEHGEEIVLPVLATVTKVSQSWATLNVGDAKASVLYCMEKPKSGPRTKPTGTHYFECVRVATAADKKLVYQVWEAIRRKAAA